MNSLSDIEDEVNHLVDKLNEPVDELIKPIVVALRYLGFNTSASCEGHLDHGFPYPWVDISYEDKKLSRSEKKRLRKYLRKFYKTRKSSHHLLLQNFNDFRLQNVKWPRSAKKRETHRELRSQELLNEYQNEMNDFADFLISERTAV